MPNIKDDKGREWLLQINLFTVRRMKLGGFDLYTLEENNLSKLKELLTDDFVLMEWIYAAVKPDADKLGVGFEDFATSFSGQTLWDARLGWEAEYQNFTPNPKIRSLFATIIETRDKAYSKALALMQQKQAEMQAIMERKMKAMEANMTPAALEKMLDAEIAAASLGQS